MGTKLKNYKPTIESCTPWNSLFTVAIAMSSFGVLVIVAIILTLKCHVNIKTTSTFFGLSEADDRGTFLFPIMKISNIMHSLSTVMKTVTGFIIILSEHLKTKRDLSFVFIIRISRLVKQ